MRAALLLLAGCTSSPDGYVPRVGAPLPENVLVIVLDDVGVDKLSSWALHPTPSPTPHIDALVDSGIRFDRAYASPTCSPTRASILTGRTPSRHGIGQWINPRSDRASLPDEEITFAELARLRGWATAAVGKWHLSIFDGEQPELDPQEQGFEHFRGQLANPDSHFRDDGQVFGYFRWEGVVDGTVSISETYLTTVQADDALELATTLPEPWLLYFAPSTPHIPFHTPPVAFDPPLSDTPADTYDAMVGAMDTELGRVLDGIDPDVRARTTIVLVGDNGTPSHSIRPPWNPQYSKSTMTEAGIRVPLSISGPRVREPGTSTDALVSAVDVFATVAGILDVDPTTLPLPIDGESLLPYATDPRTPGRRRSVLVEQFGPDGDIARAWLERAVVGQDHKLVRMLGEVDRLSAIGTDPSTEQIVEDPDAAAPLRAEMERWEAVLR